MTGQYAAKRAEVVNAIERRLQWYAPDEAAYWHAEAEVIADVVMPLVDAAVDAAVAEARREEREQCAKIAERELHADLILNEKDLLLVLEERRQIAAAIRGPARPPARRGEMSERQLIYELADRGYTVRAWSGTHPGDPVEVEVRQGEELIEAWQVPALDVSTVAAHFGEIVYDALRRPRAPEGETR